MEKASGAVSLSLGAEMGAGAMGIERIEPESIMKEAALTMHEVWETDSLQHTERCPDDWALN